MRTIAVLPERERNRLLRRVDWRFLLTSPAPARVLCPDDGLRESCVLVFDDVDATPNADSNYDLVALVDPVDASLSSGFSALTPGGGELYAEFRESTRAEITQRVEQAGFRNVRCYSPWPAPPDAEVWVPLDAPQAFDYYERVDRHVYSGLKHRLGTRVRRTRARRKISREEVDLICVIAQKLGAADTDADSPVILAALREAGIDRQAVSIALMTGGPRAISKVVGLGFIADSPEPAFAIKWPRVPESEPGLRREADALAASDARGPAPGVPRLLARVEDAPLAIAESAARGSPMFRRLTKKNVWSLTRLGAAWLSEFNARERGGLIDTPTMRELTSREIQRFADTFGPVIDQSLLDDTSRLCEQLGEIPSVIEHRDFGPWNLFLDDTRRITALDWESSRVRGLPLLDLIYFITYMAFFVDGAMVSRQFEDSYRATLDTRTAMGALRQELLDQHREQLGISMASVRALRALCWIGHAESEFQAFSADAGGRPSTDRLRGSVFARLWAIELADLR
jgi:hypothetical protein